MTESSRPGRLLGPWSASAVVVASMIGVGVFTTSGFALADLHSKPRVIAAWVLGGLFATCGTLSYGALAKRFPQSGEEYHFLARILYPIAGFLAGWISLLAGFSAPTAAAALGLQAYLGPAGVQRRKALMHAGAATQGSHYLLYDYSTAAEALRKTVGTEVPKELVDQAAAAILHQLQLCRNKDGSFIDNPLMGPDIGAGLGLQALVDLQKLEQ